MILANGCNITKSEKFKGVWILSVPTVYIFCGVRPRCARAHTHVCPLPLVFVNIKRQKDYLNMNSECLCVNKWRRRTVMFTTRTEARVKLAVILTSAASLNEDINTWTPHPKLSHFMTIWPFHLSKTILISYAHRTKVFTATRQNKSLV